MIHEITLKNLPKVSLNKFYAGTHWTKRQKLKEQYQLLVKSKVKKPFPKTEKYICHYEFTFKSRPLDASNCSAMIKILEDIIFEDDKWDIIDLGSITSRKGKCDSVHITIEQL